MKRCKYIFTNIYLEHIMKLIDLPLFCISYIKLFERKVVMHKFLDAAKALESVDFVYHNTSN